jgi:hypothetical protein
VQHRQAMEVLAQRRVFMPSVVPALGDSGGYLVFSAMKVLGRGDTIDAALLAALNSGFVEDAPPPAPRFLAEKNEVRQRGEVVAVCKSNTFAARVANALNLYQPNERML